MIRGSCLCGDIKYELDGSFQEVHHCHCSRCRKAHGAAFATFAAVHTPDLRVVSGAERVAVYASSPSVRRSFCPTCAANLFFSHERVPDLVWIAAGTFDGDVTVPTDAHLWVGSKASWWTITDELAQHDRFRPR